MLYLEDYLEMIEHLPQELRDRFTEMREMDLQVQNTTDSIEERIRVLFCNAKKLKTPERDAEYENIRKDYFKVLDDADEKVQQANQMYDLVDRYLRRLDQELHKFKMELEADNRGITEVLEKRSLELDMHNGSHSQKENRHVTSHARVTERDRERDGRRQIGATQMNRQSSTASLPAMEKTWYGETPSASQAIPTTPLAVAAPISATLGHSSSGSSVIAAAASQAIAATQQMQQGRRSASMKASYEALQQFTQSTDVGVLGITPSLALSSSDAREAAANTTILASTATKKQKKRREPVIELPVAANEPMEVVTEETMETEESVEGEWAPDPNEPRYCLCNQVSYGDMVACDNPDCPLEWFHYACVDITAPPKGKWYCPRCATSMKRRGRKQ
ncbi:inhibitor of growth protein 3-like [Daphnia pulex]|uniref:Inhibitor of growth protein n=1 Tax=Daphnia pulex TaxID=6669 RepID=E9GGF3_DAPPU|nr:inhibitor of growth protein 3-like [Daphnia pulex]XP_046657920.1 inhibitor of growth protein 3-like [Daphnia pulicaria]EFX81509.1 hypothetical protein DAPPUDRAFT_317600 [Daphnia pulex]|eukprot:EFX81509.1 hypothetical protein DAPPUDRAFT_317600 [Daphnia pulex]